MKMREGMKEGREQENKEKGKGGETNVGKELLKGEVGGRESGSVDAEKGGLEERKRLGGEGEGGGDGVVGVVGVVGGGPGEGMRGTFKALLLFF